MKNPAVRLLALFLLVLFILIMATRSSQALQRPSDGMINKAVKYGIINHNMSIRYFMGPNWIEGENGALLNIYSPFITIARSVPQHHIEVDSDTPKNIADVRKKIIEDINYTYYHPSVKFMISLYGDKPNFARNYYAKVEGIGHGSNYRDILPTKSVRQQIARKEAGARYKPYTAVNSYHFDFEQIAKLDTLTFTLFGKGLPTITFNVDVNAIN